MFPHVVTHNVTAWSHMTRAKQHGADYFLKPSDALLHVKHILILAVNKYILQGITSFIFNVCKLLV